MAEVVKTRFKQLSKTSTEWASLNPTLLEGEIGFEKDTKKIKVGDGITAWTNLDYVTGNSGVDLQNSSFQTNYQFLPVNEDAGIYGGIADAWVTNENAINKAIGICVNGLNEIDPYITSVIADERSIQQYVADTNNNLATIQAYIAGGGSVIRLQAKDNDVRLTNNGFTLNNKNILTEDTGILKQQGAENAGKVLTVGEDGNVTPQASGGGSDGNVIAKTYSNWNDLVADFESLVSTGNYRVINIQIIDVSLAENNINMKGTATNLSSHEIQDINKNFTFLGSYPRHSYSGSLPQNGIMYLYSSYNLTPSTESSLYLCTDVVALNYADSSDPFVPLHSIQIYRTASYIDYNTNNIEHLYGINRYNFSDFSSITIEVLYAEIN